MTEEGLAHSRPRLDVFTDMVFGLALSLGALTTVGQPPNEPGDILPATLHFGSGFAVLIVVWIRYSRATTEMMRESARRTALTVPLLFLASLEPYLFNFVFTQGHVFLARDVGVALTAYDVGTMLLAIDIAMLAAVLAGFDHLAIDQHDRAVDAQAARRHALARNLQAFLAAGFLVSAIPSMFWVGLMGVPLRAILWCAVPLIALGVWCAIGRRNHRPTRASRQAEVGQ